MGTKYTYNDDTTTSGATIIVSEPYQLTGSTIAYYEYVEENPYLRVLTLSSGGAVATLNNLSLASGGSMYISGGAKVNNLYISGNSNNTFAGFYSIGGLNATVSGLTARDGASIFAGGAKVYNIDFVGNYDATKDTNHLIVFSNGYGAAWLEGGFVSNAMFSIANGVVKGITFSGTNYINLVGSTNNAGAKMENCLATGKGASIRLRQNAKYVSNCTFDSGAVLEQYWNASYKSNYVDNVTFMNGAGYNTMLSSGTVKFVGGKGSNVRFISGAYLNVRSGATISKADFSDKSYANVSSGGILKAATLTGSSYITVLNGGRVEDASVISGSYITVSAGGSVTNVVGSSGGSLTIKDGNVSDIIMRGNAIVNQSSGTLTNATGRNTATFNISKGLCENLVAVGDSNTGTTINTVRASNGAVLSSAYLEKTMAALNNGAVLKDCVFGANTWINLYTGAVISGGTGINGAALRASSGTYIGTTVMGGANLSVSSGLASDCIAGNKGSIVVSAAGTVRGAVVEAGGSMDVRSGATVSNTTVKSGGLMYVQSGNNTPAQNMTLEGVTVQSGGSLVIYTSNTGVTGLVGEAGAEIKLNVYNTTADTPAAIDSLANVAEITLSNCVLGVTYNLAETGNTALRVKDSYQYFTTYATAGQEYINPLYAGRKYTVNAEGTTYKVEEYNVSNSIRTTEAADLATSGATINGGDRATLWEDVEMAAGNALTLATAAINGDAWVDLNRTQMAAGATLYGATGNYAGTIRYLVHGAGTIGNFAAGAEAGATVGNVELVGYNNTYNLTYMGGFGNVTGHVSAAVSSGNTLAKDFYAGALANYAKTGETTAIGSINATIALNISAGTAKEVKHYAKANIYGASQVKAGEVTTAATVHTVGDVTLTLANGEATKSNICVFAAGYATGHDTAKAAAVYTVDSVTFNVNGGNWGTAHGGRGIFGGAFAGDNTAAGDAGVWAKVGKVDLTIAGGTMGNVYGGGWAQKGAKSEVGDVNITITGGTMTNVYGGGTHSVTEGSGGTTVAGNVTITVSGGTITDDIYASGQLAGDSVAGASVIFTGSKAFACGVWGYSYAGGDDDATLTFDAYTGTFSGKIGGFGDGITFAGNTVMTLGTNATDVSNDSWIFDLAKRDLFYDGRAALTWSAADFTEDTITLKIDPGTRSEAWTLVSGAAATAYNTAADAFQVEIGGTAIGLTFDATTGKTDAIASGDYAGWGFAVEDSVLKFTKLA